MQPIWLISGILLITCVAGSIIFTRRRQIRRLHNLAHKHRLNYSAEDLIGIHERYQNLQIIRQGHTRHASHTIFGSTDVGMITLFCYTFDMGFGINRANQQWWMAVVETSGHHQHWQAKPANPDQTDTNQIDRFTIQADHKETIDLLRKAGIEPIFQQAPADYHWEVRGPLIAVASPNNTNADQMDELITLACKLARLIRPANNQKPI